MSDLSPLVGLCRQLQSVQNEATEQGIFIDDRALIDCPNCKLFEDVTADGLLITSRILASPPIDTSLRFREVSPNTFQCPACAEAIHLNDDFNGKK